MIPYHELVSALADWRTRQGLPTGAADYLGEHEPLTSAPLDGLAGVPLAEPTPLVDDEPTLFGETVPGDLEPPVAEAAPSFDGTIDVDEEQIEADEVTGMRSPIVAPPPADIGADDLIVEESYVDDFTGNYDSTPHTAASDEHTSVMSDATADDFMAERTQVASGVPGLTSGIQSVEPSEETMVASQYPLPDDAFAAPSPVPAEGYAPVADGDETVDIDYHSSGMLDDDDLPELATSNAGTPEPLPPAPEPVDLEIDDGGESDPV